MDDDFLDDDFLDDDFLDDDDLDDRQGFYNESVEYPEIEN